MAIGGRRTFGSRTFAANTFGAGTFTETGQTQQNTTTPGGGNLTIFDFEIQSLGQVATAPDIVFVQPARQTVGINSYVIGTGSFTTNRLVASVASRILPSISQPVIVSSVNDQDASPASQAGDSVQIKGGGSQNNVSLRGRIGY